MHQENDRALLDSHPTWMEIDAAALRHNLKEVRRRAAPGVQVIASVKANAYGHGIVPVASILAEAGVEMLATGSFEEACAIRASGIETPLLLLAGALPDAMPAVLAQGFIPTIYDLEGAKAVDHAAMDPADIFIKVDSGLGRLGVGLEDAAELLDQIADLNNVRVQGIYTHVSFKDPEGMAYTKARLSLFYELLAQLKSAGHDISITQALASSALMMGWRDDCTAVCPGHILFGLSSVQPDLADLSAFRPVLRGIKSRVIQVRDHGYSPAPDGGYHRNRQHRRTAVAPCGLNDGLRPAKDGRTAWAMFRDRPLRVIGVSLEHLTVELPDDIELAVGDELLIAGGDGDVSLHKMAGWRGEPLLETIMTFSGRMPVHVI